MGVHLVKPKKDSWQGGVVVPRLVDTTTCSIVKSSMRNTLFL